MDQRLRYQRARAERIWFHAVQEDLRDRLAASRAPVVVRMPPPAPAPAPKPERQYDLRGVAVVAMLAFWALVFWLVWQAGS